MVVVSIEPDCWFMERAGIATGTRNVALRLLAGTAARSAARRTGAGTVRGGESRQDRTVRLAGHDRSDLSGHLTAGLRLPTCRRRVSLSHRIELRSARSPQWLEQVIHILPVAPRPEGYNPLGEKNLDPQWIERLGKTGQDCFDAILRRDVRALGDSMNECMACWEAMLPHTVRHPTVTVDLLGLLRHYQSQFAGAMYSGCGGGYLFVVSEQPVPGALHATVRIA